MVNHPKRNRLAAYCGRIIETDGRKTVELRDPNDNAKRRYQYRRCGPAHIERRVLQGNGKPFRAGSPWEQMTVDEVAQLHMARGEYHPILDPLGITAESIMDEARIDTMFRREG